MSPRVVAAGNPRGSPERQTSITTADSSCQVELSSYGVARGRNTNRTTVRGRKLKFQLLRIRRAASDEYRKASGLDYARQSCIVEGEVLHVDGEGNRASLTRIQPDAAKRTQLLHRTGDTPDIVANVELNDLVTGHPPGIGDGHLDAYRVSRPHRCRARSWRAVTKGRIAQAVPERIEGRPGHVVVFGRVLVVLGRGTAGPAMIVVDRHLPRHSREGRSQLAAGVVIAEQYVRCRGPVLDSQEPRLDDRRHVVVEPLQCERTAVHQHRDYGFSCRDNRLRQALLCAG